jgi:hypothetical protein
MIDLRPRVVLSLRSRSFAHWTPRYLRYRIQALLRARLRPHEPSLTPRAVTQLASMLRPEHVGVEWGSGNTTRWLAKRTKHLTTFETDPAYYEQVAASLRAERIANVDYQLIPHDFEGETNEEEMHRNAFVRAAYELPDESLDYALVDSAPRGCLCFGVAPKIRRGGLLVLDNANWYLPPPRDVRPSAPGSVDAVLGTPGSRIPHHECWPAFARMVESWQAHWSSNGLQMTLILVKR